jgi:hypothetical protein
MSVVKLALQPTTPCEGPLPDLRTAAAVSPRIWLGSHRRSFFQQSHHRPRIVRVLGVLGVPEGLLQLGSKFQNRHLFWGSGGCSRRFWRYGCISIEVPYAATCELACARVLILDTWGVVTGPAKTSRPVHLRPMAVFANQNHGRDLIMENNQNRDSAAQAATKARLSV